MTTQSTRTDPEAIGSSDKELAPGTEVGEYRIEAVAGRGGFGTVYRAIQPVIGKQVAIKVLARRFAADEGIVSRFVAEARAVNQIRHRNIIDIFSFGQLPDGRHYYVMEYLEGAPLDVHLRERGPLSLDEALPILKAVARALDAAHAKGIAHRDLKPENIFLARDPDGQQFPKLLDFGIAKLLVPEEDVRHHTGTGVPLGTPYYMSPEQCRGRDVDHRTDIYSFGILCYRVLTATYPFEGDYIELMTKQIGDEPEPPSARNPALSSQVDHAIAWMMKKDPAERPRTVLAGASALAGEATAQTTPSLPPTPLPRTTRPGDPAAAAATVASLETQQQMRRMRRIGPLIGLSMAAVAAGVTWYVARREPAPAAAPAPAPAPVKVAPAPTPPPVAPPPSAPAHPDRVTITLKGAPSDAVVSAAGTRIGLAPTIQLRYGDRKVLLLVDADGYQPAQVAVTPDRDQDVPVSLRKRPHPRPAPREPDRDSLPAFPNQ